MHLDEKDKKGEGRRTAPPVPFLMGMPGFGSSSAAPCPSSPGSWVGQEVPRYRAGEGIGRLALAPQAVIHARVTVIGEICRAGSLGGRAEHAVPRVGNSISADMVAVFHTCADLGDLISEGAVAQFGDAPADQRRHVGVYQVDRFALIFTLPMQAAVTGDGHLGDAVLVHFTQVAAPTGCLVLAFL